jgi:hypothetical protein
MDFLMKFFSRNKNWDKPFSEKVAKRIDKLTTSELKGWIEPSIYSVGQTFSSYQKTGSDQTLDNLLLGVEALHATVDEIRKRTPRS